MSACILLIAAVLFVLKLDPRKSERLSLGEIADAAALLTFGLGLAVLSYWAATRPENPDNHDDAIDEIAAALDGLKRSLTDLVHRLKAIEAGSRRVSFGLDSPAAASREDESALVATSPLPSDSVEPASPVASAHAAHAVEQRDFAREREKIESLMSIARWEEALRAAEELVHDFPERDDSRVMLERVRREQAVFVDGLASRLYEQVKQASARKEWRKALSAARRLVDELPTHPRTAKVKPTLETLVANAEIEERQEREDEIQLMVRSHRLDEAIELSERLIADYPNSPQARSLRELIPKLRQRAREL